MIIEDQFEPQKEFKYSKYVFLYYNVYFLQQLGNLVNLYYNLLMLSLVYQQELGNLKRKEFHIFHLL